VSGKKDKGPGVTGAFSYDGRYLKIRKNTNNMQDCYKMNSGQFDWTSVGKIVA
jgi:hypothetical protein